MTPLEHYLYDVRNGMAGSRFTSNASREARNLKLVGYRSAYGEIKTN